MRKKVFIGAVLAMGMAVYLCGCGAVSIEENNSDSGDGGTSTTEEAPVTETEPIIVEKSENGNPITGFDAEGNLIYGGDPAALVLGDTVYLYTGHDTASEESYVIPEWQCYSSKDMVNWNYEGVILKCTDVDWADNVSAWAAQMAVHYDKESGKDMYYFYYCSWDKNAEGKQSIGVAVSDSPTGPFTDIGEALVKGTFTENESSGWNDIDPTIWIETDESGEEHRYLAWGNGKYYICELNEDMISVKDLDGDGQIVFGRDVLEKTPPPSYTEAPWFYRQQDENGNYYGRYYLFYAYGWREQMAYATTDDLINGEWEFGDIIMEPTATSNTNHMSVIDFNGKTYFIYHNGSLPGGSGFRRVACVEELVIEEDGTVAYIPETAVGISGKAVTIKNTSGDMLGHYHLTNAVSDSVYPYVDLIAGINLWGAEEEDQLWQIVPGLADPDNETYVSIESDNKPGLYLTESGEKGVRLTQDAEGNLGAKQTFKTVKGLNGEDGSVSFESVSQPGQFIMTDEKGNLALGNGSDRDACTFKIGE